MATNKRRARNNNPEGKNQYSETWLGDNKLTAAVAVGGAVAAGAFLWSRRAQISEEISRLGEQIGEWRDNMMAEDQESLADEGAETAFIAKPKRVKVKARKSQKQIAEEALTLKDLAPTAERPVDPVVEDQLKVGAVAY